MSHLWHSPLSSSLPYINSVESYTERGLMYGSSPMNVVYDEEDIYRLEFEEEIEIASSTEHMTSCTSSTSSSTTTSNDGSDDEIDAIRRAIEITLGSDKEDTVQNTNPRTKYLARIGVGTTRPTPVTVTGSSTSRSSTSTSTSRQVSPRTPPTSPNDVADDDSLDAMLALMGVSDEMTTPRVTRSSPIDIPRKISRPIPIPTRVSHPHPRPSARICVDAWSTKPSQLRPSHGWDSDDDADESYFDSPQTEDVSGSMLFDY